MGKPYVPVGLSKAEAFALRFALWCQRLAIPPADGAQLVALARRAFHAGERAVNYGTQRNKAAELRTAAALEEKARALGFAVAWPGLWPELTRGGAWIEIPAA